MNSSDAKRVVFWQQCCVTHSKIVVVISIKCYNKRVGMLLVLYGVKLKIEVCLLQNYKNLYRLKVIEGLQ